MIDEPKAKVDATTPEATAVAPVVKREPLVIDRTARDAGKAFIIGGATIQPSKV